MTSFSDLPEVISLFPLPGALLLPRARLPLHIFEPRYLALLDDCLKSDRRMIGMIQPRGDAVGAQPRLAQVGCAGRLTSFSEMEDGRYMVTVTGIIRFSVAEELTGFQPYRRARPDWTPFSGDLRHEEDEGFDRPVFLKMLGKYFQTRKMGTDWASLKEADTEMLVNALSMLCPFSVEEKQALLEAPTLVQRRMTLETLISFALQRGGSSDEVLQ